MEAAEIEDSHEKLEADDGEDKNGEQNQYSDLLSVNNARSVILNVIYDVM